MADTPLPKKFDHELWRGDTRVFEHHFNEDAPAWQPSTAYVVGVVGEGPIGWVASSTVTFNGVTYTCTTAHTSGASFDASFWTADPAAVGAPIDITGWVFLSEYRVTTEDAAPTATDTNAITNGPGGVLQRTLPHSEAAKLVPGIMTWDLQATKPDASVQTYLYSYKVKVDGDTAR